ncbi:hypothetical protein LCGC14_1409180 [marine sediment metagenome]|uniref:Uncharacterized protein n=1 Tax=marine sediment metagenome TaxID=412755 RepID=A0A0F9MWE9_9ZZZZ
MTQQTRTEKLIEEMANLIIPLYGGHETQGTSDLSDEGQQDALLWARIKAKQLAQLLKDNNMVFRVELDLRNPKWFTSAVEEMEITK